MLGIIGGSGLYGLESLQATRVIEVETVFGLPSSALTFVRKAKDDETGLNATRIDSSEKDKFSSSLFDMCFLARHGEDHSIPPHKVNYRANIQALVDAGVNRIISVNAVGSCNLDIAVGSLLMPMQIIDYSYGREHTFFDCLGSFDDHIDFTFPFTAELQQQIHQIAEQRGLAVPVFGTYGCTQGPRLETAAEIQRLIKDGCDLVGMTVMPEAGLARERGIDYVSLCMVVNPAAGLTESLVSTKDISTSLESTMANVKKLLWQCC